MPGMLKLTTCGCGTASLVRLRRSWWMRLLPNRRRYQCARCGADLLLDRRDIYGLA
jgi:hypothetical protein